MGNSSRAPALAPTHEWDEQDEDKIDTQLLPRPMLRLSRMPVAHANIEMPHVEQTFRRLGTQPPGRPDNDTDTLTEDELFAIWRSRLL